ncbi:uncharacterized protein LOC111077178 [Drosophila obscura]|uniref:uncharacterized protein LOC111077178 n=1 Tax=Drosophila obscura TaxID=7282 RepID=UPI001BB1E4B5|nr:uncharacterized protein LOC111077178 [Drosophila obscura]
MDKDIEMTDMSQGPSTSKSKNIKLEEQSQSGTPTTLPPYNQFIEKYRKTVPEKTESEQIFEAAAMWNSMSVEERKNFCFPEKQPMDDAQTEANEDETDQDVANLNRSCLVS